MTEEEYRKAVASMKDDIERAEALGWWNNWPQTMEDAEEQGHIEAIHEQALWFLSEFGT